MQISALVISQLGNLDDEYVTGFNGEVVPIPQFLDEEFGYKWSFLWPTVAIQLAFIAFLSGLCIFAAAKLNFQRR